MDGWSGFHCHGSFTFSAQRSNPARNLARRHPVSAETHFLLVHSKTRCITAVACLAIFPGISIANAFEVDFHWEWETPETVTPAPPGNEENRAGMHMNAWC